MTKLKDVYLNNPALGDPNMLDKKLEENAQKLEAIRQELHKFEVRFEGKARGSRGLVVRRLLGMQEVLGSNPLGTKTLCWFLLFSHFFSSTLLSNVCHSS